MLRGVEGVGVPNPQQQQKPSDEDDVGGAAEKQEQKESPRQDRKTQYGIDCVDMVHFSHWEPGGEYVKTIIVKNVVMKTQKIRYKLPQTRYFSMEFPETQTLSAGMKWSIPVTFRPVAKESYDDVIEFSTSFGIFQLPIKATLPEHVMEFPKIIDFGYCPLKETARINFQLKNIGELKSYYEWSMPTPFFISPETGELDPGKSCSVLVEFKPKDALVIDAVAICSFGVKNQWEKTKLVKAAKIFGIAKFSHLVIEGEMFFDFGNVYIGTSVEKTIILNNPSAVHANFKIKRAEKDNDTCFDFSTISGRVDSHSRFELKIKYTPMASGLQSNAYFDITTLSGNTSRIMASGCGQGPKVCLEPDMINFGDMAAGTSLVKTFSLKNDSGIPANYQFLIEKNSTFRIDKLFGTIAPNSTISIQVKMCPSEAINYHRRLYCLVDNQDTIYIDFIGTCFNDKRRPATFKPEHFFNYQRRVLNGLVEFGPEQLEEMMKSGILHCNNGILEYIDPVVAREKAITSKRDQPYKNATVTSEYFYSNSGDTLACSLLDTYVDFGSCSRYKVIEPKTIRVANHTKGKMTCVWMDNDDSNGEPLFTVTPKMADIPSKSIVEFKVQFRPKSDSEFYGKQLEGFCYFKSMRNFRLVNEDTFSPPWCITPEVSGNTFPPGEDTFIPKINFGRTRVVFPPCYVDRSEYQTIKIANAGDTTVKFSFLDNANTAGIGGDTEMSHLGGPAFSVKPRVGVLKKNESRLIVLRFSPSEKRLYEEGFTCFFNNSIHSKYDLQLRGFGAYPEIGFEKDNTLYFKPTCIGSLASRTFPIRNKSKASLFYEWQIPKQYSNVIAIDPISGFLEADEMASLQCTFAPPVESDYSLKIPCYYFHDDKNGEKQRATLFIKGQGIFGMLTASPAQVIFSNILINTATEKEIVLFNPSECDITFSLGLKKLVGNTLQIIPNDLQESEIQVYQKSKVLPARSNETIKIKTCLQNESIHEFLIYYKTDSKTFLSFNQFFANVLNTLEEKIAAEKGLMLPKNVKLENEHFPLTTVKANGVHPVISVRDVRGEGLSKTVLWQLFSIDRFNELLFEPTSDPFAYAELILEDDSFPTDNPEIEISPLEADINFDFGATSVGIDPTLLKMAIQNDGVVAVDWAFMFPNDAEVEIERWADPGDVTEEQVTRNFILDNSIFGVSPKFGKLEPGQSVHVLFSYSHEFAGPHRLPVLFKLKNGQSRAGKEIRINFIGYSVPPTQKFLHLQSINHDFTPINIGTVCPPIQYYRMMNKSSSSLEYQIDTSAIKTLNTENLNFEVFKCLKTSGVIPAGGTEFLEFIFNPLEEKVYELDLPITVDQGKTRMITLRGKGIREGPALDRKMNMDPRNSYQSIPQVPTLPPLVNPVATISLERIDFGHVPINAILRQVVVISNSSKTENVSVAWKIPSVWQENAIKISPPTKQLAPQESQVFRIVFQPDDSPRLYNFDLICEVTNETAMENYIRDNPVMEEAQLLSGESSESKSKVQLRTVSGASTSSHGPDIKTLKYKPLPSIQSSHGMSASTTPQTTSKPTSRTTKDILGIATTADTIAQLELMHMLNDPPAPISYYIGVNAQSHTVQEFRELYTRYSTFYTPKRTGFSTAKVDIKSSLLADQKDLVSDIMQSLLVDVFQDSTIQDLTENISKEPMPYFKAPLLDQKETKHDSKDKSNFTDHQLLKSADFLNAVEAALEGTIYNLMQEIDNGDFDCTRYPMLVSKAEFNDAMESSRSKTIQ